MGMGSRALFNRAEQQAYFINAINALTNGELVPVPGGVLIRDKNNKGQPMFEEINFGQPIELVVGITGMESLTAETVTKVRQAWTQSPERYESLFNQIEQLTLSGLECLKTGKVEELGELMNICHGYLNALQLSTPELEELVHIARSHGALGAKLTGGGGGGSMIALCQDNKDEIESAMNKAGYKTLPYSIG